MLLRKAMLVLGIALVDLGPRFPKDGVHVCGTGDKRAVRSLQRSQWRCVICSDVFEGSLMMFRLSELLPPGCPCMGIGRVSSGLVVMLVSAQQFRGLIQALQ